MADTHDNTRSGFRRYGYGDLTSDFLVAHPNTIVGELTNHFGFAVESTQNAAWRASIECLKNVLTNRTEAGWLYLEFDVPRMGRRIDAVLVLKGVVFVIEFKVGANKFLSQDIDQVVDYVLDLKHFHETSHVTPMVPVLVATDARSSRIEVAIDGVIPGLYRPLCCSSATLGRGLDLALELADSEPIDAKNWVNGRYRPTPTIVEAAKALYARHSVHDISRSDATNLGETSAFVGRVIDRAKIDRKKAICFVTGVPGAGKTLVGLDVATRSSGVEAELHAVYLSGNGPLVKVLQEALALDRVRRDAESGTKTRIGDARRQVSSFIQSVHHFRDEELRDDGPPHDHVAIFDEAQRAWDVNQTAKFMKSKRGLPSFDQSEPEFLVSCLNRHNDWAVVVCLIGNGQEINVGEAGIVEWLESVERRFPDWDVHVSPKFGAGDARVLELKSSARKRNRLFESTSLHLATSVRSFRSERYSDLVNRLLDLDVAGARDLLAEATARFPLKITRDLSKAKQWLRSQARGSERYGIVVSSEAQRLRPHAIDVRVKIDPVHWFLRGKEDTRSSYYMEDVATEFQVQGLELDWTCVVWDGDLRRTQQGWDFFSFVGDRWNRIHKEPQRRYLVNAYRVLLTRARQGTVIVVPHGDESDATRSPSFYDPVFHYLKELGLSELA